MAKREISSTLRNLKFMQRAALREGIVTRKKEEHKPPEPRFFSPGVDRKCVVMMEGDPIPGAIIGRMSFGSFNPSVDKLNEAAAADVQDPRISDVDASSSNDQNGGGHSSRNMYDGSSPNGTECSNTDSVKFEANGDLKRKQSILESREHNQKNKSPKTVQGGQQSSPGSSRSSSKKPKSEKLDWSVLRPKEKHKRNGHR